MLLTFMKYFAMVGAVVTFGAAVMRAFYEYGPLIASVFSPNGWLVVLSVVIVALLAVVFTAIERNT